jgi:hypothetical protein
MAEKSSEKPAAKKRSASSSRQQMLETYAQTVKEVEDRGEGQAKPEERLEARNVREAVVAADALSTEGVVKSIGELRSTIGKTLAQLSDRLEEEVSKYVQIQRAILAKEAELKEIYEIQKSASTLTALIEAQQRRRDEFESELAADRESLTQEIESTRTAWEAERKSREAEIKEQVAAEQKRREREREEYRYAFAREQQLTKDRFADEMSKAQRELEERKSLVEKELAERENVVASSESELAEMRRKIEAFPEELRSSVAKAAQDATGTANARAAAGEELLKREFAGERNVLTTRVAALEQTAKEQAAQLLKLSQQAEKAYTQVQDIAVKAIEGSSNFKSLTNLQQLLTEQGRKQTSEK